MGVGALERWDSGALELWSAEALKRWSFGALELWSAETLKRWGNLPQLHYNGIFASANSVACRPSTFADVQPTPKDPQVQS